MFFQIAVPNLPISRKFDYFLGGGYDQFRATLSICNLWIIRPAQGCIAELLNSEMIGRCLYSQNHDVSIQSPTLDLLLSRIVLFLPFIHKLLVLQSFCIFHTC